MPQRFDAWMKRTAKIMWRKYGIVSASLPWTWYEKTFTAGVPSKDAAMLAGLECEARRERAREDWRPIAAMVNP